MRCRPKVVLSPLPLRPHLSAYPTADRLANVSIATPRPAASVILLRRGGKHAQRGLEVLLLKRSEQASFMPGVWVFPGGAVDPEDGEGETGFQACALRELSEEASIELD